MKRELSGIKTGVGEVQDRLDRVESDLGSVKVDIREIKEMLQTSLKTLTSTNSGLAELTDYVHEKLVTRADFHGRMDGFAGRA
ncbi:MAG TPA: hypothetical protein DCZ01_01165 [Elusimicrobia bacterium]|nr:MAG: hypothetical protein A2X37_03265 [Elusimicrobia bacterium GWA2_66_18]HAZ07143.1 hypothetical protein [Elusimicrobiota bacterium]